MPRFLSLFLLGSFLFLARSVDAATQLVVATRFVDHCSTCTVDTRGVRTATAFSGAALTWRPGLDAQNAVLRFSFASKSPATITIRQGERVLVQKRVEESVWELDVPIAKLSRGDELRLESDAAKGASWLDPVILVPARDQRPNILLICVDTLRADRLAAMPKTFAWLRRGARFTHAYANATWTLPSISTILTGVPPGVHNAGRRTDLGAATTQYDLRPRAGTHGYQMTMVGRKYEFRRLSPTIPTLPEMLRGAGYYTAAIHSNGYLDHPIGALRGFDLAQKYFGDGAGGTPTAFEWLARNRASRFALFLHYIDVHQWPLEIPDELRKTPPERYTSAQRALINSVYDKKCAEVDAQLDKLLAELESTGVLKNTIVILTADHGEAIAEYGRVDGHGAGVEENILRVPLAIFGPGIRPIEVATRVSLLSIVPTILDSARVPSRTEIASRSLRPLMNGAKQADRSFISEFVLYFGDQSAMYAGKWKYVEAAGGKQSLFDLTHDPAALTDVTDANPAIAEQMRRDFRRRQVAMLKQLQSQHDEGITLSPETIESLRALGYLGGQ